MAKRSKKNETKLYLVAGVTAVAVIAGLYYLASPRTSTPTAGGSGQAIVAVRMPEIRGLAVEGQKIFTANCARCHGPDAGGIDGSGPPLVHKIYAPGHHGDMAFILAAQRGVRKHHWQFGDMPPVDGVSGADMGSVVDFIRQVQQANGIY